MQSLDLKSLIRHINKNDSGKYHTFWVIILFSFFFFKWYIPIERQNNEWWEFPIVIFDILESWIQFSNSYNFFK